MTPEGSKGEKVCCVLSVLYGTQDGHGSPVFPSSPYGPWHLGLGTQVNGGLAEEQLRSTMVYLESAAVYLTRIKTKNPLPLSLPLFT